MTTDSLVSIIMPCFNAEPFIDEAICSVESQTYTNWELIIVDDGSCDNSCLLVEKHLAIDTRIKLIRNARNIGVAKSRNIAMDVATGEYIAFLDSDDFWYPDKLMSQLTFMNHQNVAMTYSSYDVVSNDGKKLTKINAPLVTDYNGLLKGSLIGTLTTIYNAKKLGKFYFQTIGHEDYALKLDILRVIKRTQGQQVVLAAYRVTKNSLSRNKFKAAVWRWRVYRHQNISLLRKVYYFFYYIWYGISGLVKSF